MSASALFVASSGRARTRGLRKFVKSSEYSDSWNIKVKMTACPTLVPPNLLSLQACWGGWSKWFLHSFADSDSEDAQTSVCHSVVWVPSAKFTHVNSPSTCIFINLMPTKGTHGQRHSSGVWHYRTGTILTTPGRSQGGDSHAIQGPTELSFSLMWC